MVDHVLGFVAFLVICASVVAGVFAICFGGAFGVDSAQAWWASRKQRRFPLCPKCGERTKIIRYCASCNDAPELDHIHRKCHECGHTWTHEPLDRARRLRKFRLFKGGKTG